MADLRQFMGGLIPTLIESMEDGTEQKAKRLVQQI